ncbi:MAG TPA: hypothetical protein VHO71_05835 [Caproiciproducens sp.]|nr:hypothetical protein [Caproiciproducens sp.]
MKIYNCCDPAENPAPLWMIQNAVASEKEAESDTQTVTEKTQNNLPDFSYTQNCFFPEFCKVKHI